MIKRRSCFYPNQTSAAELHRHPFLIVCSKPANRFRLTISHHRISRLQFALHVTVSKPFYPASNFCPLITNASKPLRFVDFTNFSTASFFRRLLRQVDAPIAEQLLSNSFAPPSPSRCSLCLATAFKSLLPLRSCGASFAHNYSSPINRFLSHLIRLIYLMPSLPAIQLTLRSASHLFKSNLIPLSSSSRSTSASSFAARSWLVPLLPSPHNTRSCCGCAQLALCACAPVVGAAVSTEPCCA